MNIHFFSKLAFLILATNICACEQKVKNESVDIEVSAVSQSTKGKLDISDSAKAFNRNKNLGRGMNFGNALEAPTEGEWGMVIKEQYIQELVDAGFNSVRLPICWSAHTAKIAPYAIDAAFLSRIDEVLDWCLKRNLAVIITIHHFNEFYDAPDDINLQNMFFAIWKQLCLRYGSLDHEKLFFEVLNEPHNNLTAAKWNAIVPNIIDTVRTYDSDRTIIIDVPDYAYHESIGKLVIPASERNIIVSVRYYMPYEFTHQGAHWVSGSDAWLGRTWTGSTTEKNTVETDLNKIKTWADNNGRPVNIGEFGAIATAGAASRLVWTRYVTRSFENHGFSWCYFDFGVIFKAFDVQTNQWISGFKEALVPINTGIREVK